MDAFVARQPIYNRAEKLVGYELFYRDSITNAFPVGVSDMEATSKLINNTHLTLGINQLTHNRIALINFNEEALLNRLPLLLSPKEVVIEVLETVSPSDEVYAAIKELSDKGYIIALDDFVYSRKWTRFLRIVNILKLDIQSTPLSSLHSFVANLRKALPGLKLLAEKIETVEEYQQAKDMGFSFFQGYYFGMPSLDKLTTIEPQTHSILSVYKLLLSNNPTIDKVVEVVNQDTALLYKLLRYINSGAFGQTVRIKSVRSAINYIGLERMKKFIALLLTCSIGKDRPEELVISAITRAKMSELIAYDVNANAEKAFFIGLLSKMDALLKVPLAMVLKQINVTGEIEMALLGTKQELTKETHLLRNILRIVTLHETGSWYETQKVSELVGVKYEKVSAFHSNAIKWVNNFLCSVELVDPGEMIDTEELVPLSVSQTRKGKVKREQAA